MPHSDVTKILILRFSSLGDIVMTTAAIRRLRARFPSAKIDMVVGEEYLDLIALNPHLDEKIPFSRKEGNLIELLKRLNRERYDCVYDAHSSLRTLFLLPLLKADSKLRYQKHYFRRNLTLATKLPFWSDRSRALDRHVLELAPWGVVKDDKGPEVFVSKEKVDEIEARFGRKQSVRVGFVPSAQWPGKRWPNERFRTLAEEILRRTDYSIWFFGGKGDTFCVEMTEGLDSKRVLNLQGQLSLMESMAALSVCDFVVSNDTGLLHVADALKKPSIAILGPTSDLLGCLPFHPNSEILEHKLWCRPCSKNGQAPCIRSERFCLTKTRVEDVFASVLKLGRLCG